MSLFDEFLHNMCGKKVAVIGIGISNQPLIGLLADAGAIVTAYDKKSKEELGEICDAFLEKGVKLSLGEEYLKHLNDDYIFRTPGMHPNNEALLNAQSNGSIITSEMEMFFAVCPCPIIAITGSDGKTTTTTLTYEILKKAGYTCHLGGNIGKPLLADTPNMKQTDYAIVELSSFQLMTFKTSAKIAAVTNVTPNHLDIHKDMAEYIEAKTNVFKYQESDARLILNADDTVSQSFKGNGEVIQFSMLGAVENGVFLQGDTIYYAKNGVPEEVMKTSDIKIPGDHNIANYMTAIALTLGLCNFDDVKDVARNFGGVAHRIELVRTKHGVRYYNDSIASSPTRTIAGLKSFKEKVVLIAGGYDKHIPYDVLGPEIVEHVKMLVLTGATADKIEKSVLDADGKMPIYKIDDFKEAVIFASKNAKEGDVVILSPASASFDHFKNFAERGNFFKDIVNNL